MSMRYSPDVKLWWRTGYKLFHGKFIRFMGGPKHHGQLLEGTAVDSKLLPQDAKINFAVPSAKYLETASVIKTELKPGVIQECVETVSIHAKQVKISFDSKKINGSLTHQQGDVDLFGCETRPTLSELNQRKAKESDLLNEMAQKCERGTLTYKEVQNAVQVVSTRIRELREMACLKEQGVIKFKSLGHPDWRTSKYVFVISSLQSSLFEIAATVKACLDTTDKLCQISAKLQDADQLYCLGERPLDLQHQRNYVCVGDGAQEKITGGAGITRYVLQQRTEEWHNLRSTGHVTGSSAHRSLGLNSFKDQVAYYDEKFLKKEPPVFSDLLKKQLEHGQRNELNAVATLVGKIFPAFYPHLRYIEEGCIVLERNDKNFLVVSPDGSGRTDAHETACLGLEIKCPYTQKSFVPQVHYQVPYYYVVQLLCEMTALQCTSLLFLSYTSESTTFFKVQYSEPLWKRIWEELERLYGDELPKRPSKLSKCVPALKQQLKDFVAQNTEFLGEIPSLTSTPCKHESPSSTTFHNHEDEVPCLHNAPPLMEQETPQALYQAQECVKEAANLCRKRATEMFLFMMSDLHRHALPSLPVAYGLQGPSLDTATVRRMLQRVLVSAEENHLEVVSFCCDGQFIKLVTSDMAGKPLTALQHQKAYYEEIKKIPKQTLLKYFNDLQLRSGEAQTGVRVVSMADVAIKRRHLRLMSGKRTKKHSDTKPEEENDCTGNAISLLPENLGDKVDDCTYQEILTVVKDLITTKSRDTCPDEDTAQDCSSDDRQQEGQDVMRPTVELDEGSLQIILSALQSDNQVKNQHQEKWKRVDTKELRDSLHSGDKLSLPELKVTLKTMKYLFPQETKHVLLASPKQVLLEHIHRLLIPNFIGMPETSTSRMRSKKCPNLRDLALKTARTLPKDLLCALYAEIEYPDKERQWRMSFPFSSTSMVNNQPLKWFSYPETRSEQQKPLLGIIDSHHILTNLRTKVCKTGIVESKIHREAWVKVATECRSNQTGLTLAHVDDLIDRQRNSFAQLTFSEPVQLEMRKNGHLQEADFCRMIRLWYRADDEGGIEADQRLEWRLSMRNWLLGRYDPAAFPPPAGYVGGVPTVTFEALLTNVERKIQMYAFAKAFNTRSLTTLDAENFFGVLADMTPGGSGLAIRPRDIPDAVKTACEISILQTDANKSFHMHTAKAPVYPKMEMCPAGDDIQHVGDSAVHSSRASLPHSRAAVNTEMELCRPQDERRQSDGFDGTYSPDDMSVIQTRNHDFDLPARAKRKSKRKSAGVSKPNEPSRGAQGVRQHHRTDETKILPHKRLGIMLND
ncbi:hypothetical protein V1264_008000 [Littorina saxatilis]